MTDGRTAAGRFGTAADAISRAARQWYHQPSHVTASQLQRAAGDIRHALPALEAASPHRRELVVAVQDASAGAGLLARRLVTGGGPVARPTLLLATWASAVRSAQAELVGISATTRLLHHAI